MLGDWTEAGLLNVAAAELGSEHLLGEASVAARDRGLPMPPVAAFEAIPGTASTRPSTGAGCSPATPA